MKLLPIQETRIDKYIEQVATIESKLTQGYDMRLEELLKVQDKAEAER